MRLSPELIYTFKLESDIRKKFQVKGNFVHAHSSDETFRFSSGTIGLSLRPINALEFSLSSTYSSNNNNLQFVENVLVNDTRESIMARIKQRTLALSFRANYNLNPNLTLQYWAQPFNSNGTYTNFKMITNAEAMRFRDRFNTFESSQVDFDPDKDAYGFDYNHDDRADFSIKNPDFSLVQLRSNLVLRWEYTPGSELFLVWSQNFSERGNPDGSVFENLRQELFGSQLSNTYLIKLTYRFL